MSFISRLLSGDVFRPKTVESPSQTVAGNMKGATSRASQETGKLMCTFITTNETNQPVSVHKKVITKTSVNEKHSYKDPATVQRVCYGKIHGPNQQQRLLRAIAYLEEKEPKVFKGQKGIEKLKETVHQGSPSPMESTEASVQDIVFSEPEDETSQESLLSGRDREEEMVSEKEVQKDAKHIRHHLLGLCERPSDKGAGWTQSFQASPTSETQKYNVPSFMGRFRDVVNLGSCASENKVLYVRSGNTRYPDQYKTKGEEAAKAVVAANDTSKIRYKDGKQTIRRYCCSFMDESYSKHLATSAKSMLSNIKGKDVVIESERNFLAEKKEGANEYVPLYETVLHEWTDDNGITHQVHEETPLVAQTVFSKLAGDSTLHAQAEKANKQSYAVLIYSSFEGISNLTEGMSDDMKNIVNTYVLNDLKEICKDAWSNVDKLDNAIEQLSYLRGPELSPEDANQLETVIAHLKAIRGLVGPPQTDAVKGSLKSFLSQMLLCNAAGFIPDIECKSGNDRTAIGATLLVCQDLFIKENGRPLDIDDTNDFKRLQELFAENFVLVAKQNLEFSRGGEKPEVKVNNPIFNLLVPEGSKAREDISQHLTIAN